MQTSHQWITGPAAWTFFVERHPELGYRPGKWQFHNFLRFYRDALLAHDAIRRAKNRFWIAHLGRFTEVAFDCATGVLQPPQRAGGVA